jgi:hypothetical protein
LVATRDFEASPFSQAKLAPTENPRILAQILHPENAEPDHLRTCKLPVGTTEGIPILAQILHPENAEPDHLRTCKLPVGTTEGIPLLVSFHPETRPCHSERSEESLRIQ